jgi:hypothetical protein
MGLVRTGTGVLNQHQEEVQYRNRVSDDKEELTHVTTPRQVGQKFWLNAPENLDTSWVDTNSS